MTNDDELIRFEAKGAPALPTALTAGHVEHDGAKIFYSSYGAGLPVVLLHGGLGHSGNFAYQLPALLDARRRVILIDSRGHGRSTRDKRPLTYVQMANDVAAVLDALKIPHAAIAGWSDGACTALALALAQPSRVEGVFFFGCNVDPSGAKPFVPSPLTDRCISRHKKDYEHLSATPKDFKAFSEWVQKMQETLPNYSAKDLAQVSVPVNVVYAEHDEFIKREHEEYLARTLPHGKLVLLAEVSHFAPLQRPDVFNRALSVWLDGLH